MLQNNIQFSLNIVVSKELKVKRIVQVIQGDQEKKNEIVK
jgi:hypothetical protein